MIPPNFQKPGFYDNFGLNPQIWARNPVSCLQARIGRNRVSMTIVV
ncbi:hypothetical protein [Planktothricoides raciborskii]|uniref:Transposase n=1 Tax=Planktothricoides raciborskii FACHB-1370 TaxID=2949576 RepID=A0ABR8EI27_9CYAN|nr:hypothetical protein [Planktothricoides raciborskii]MBD2545952.1 hypothetical protein [Planktothricoides raciborskii FACHB-1370]MBD2584069.1 hypothetical protein [Planktothricoides raciborskii FACHB-1261]